MKHIFKVGDKVKYNPKDPRLAKHFNLDQAHGIITLSKKSNLAYAKDQIVFDVRWSNNSKINNGFLGSELALVDDNG